MVGRQNKNNDPQFKGQQIENKNIDHRGKETCAYKSDDISFCCDSAMSNALNLCFFIYFFATQKKKIISEKN